MNKKTTQAVEIGAGVAAVAALAGAGYYFYASPKAKKHRQAASKWATGLKRDVIREAKKLEKIDARSVARIVDSAAGAYQDIKSLDKADLRAAVKELKANWDMLAKDAGHGAKKAAKKMAKKAVKKTVKKSAKKRI